MDTTLQDPLVGRVLDGRYRVGPRLARGGMATVYEGVDTRLDRPVALKVMHPGLAEDQDFVARFIREAKAAARLSHPGIVAVFDQGTDGSTVFLAMEYVEGRTLRDLLRERGRLSPRHAFEVLEPVLAALGAAHHAGIVHRDVKPENVLLADDGRVKVADFGLARAVSTSTSHTSTAGMLIGTVAYLSPEQVERGVADPRSDVYAAGILLYEMLTGRKPYDGDSPIQVAYRHVHDDVPAPSRAVPGLPAEIDALVLAATARDADRRPADANRFLADLVRVRDSLSDAELDGEGLADAGGDQHTLVVPLAGTSPGTPVPAAGDTAVVPVAAGRHDTQVIGTQVLGAQAVSPPAAGPAGPNRPVAGPPARSSRRRRGVIALLVVLLLAAGLSGAAWWVGAGPGAWTTTPPVLGLTAADAKAKLTRAGFTVELGDPAFSETVAKGHVISSDPAAKARIRKNGTVTLTLSKGKERYPAPDLSGMTEEQARAALAKAHLGVGDIGHAYDDNVAKGKVVSQSPDPRTSLKRDTAVSFVVSKGLPPVRVPDVRNSPLDGARAVIAKAGLRSRVAREEFSDTVPRGVVIDQQPTSGTMLKGSTVALVVSKGPDLVDVPDLSGKKLAEATKVLRELGLKVDVMRAPFGPGKVFDQSAVGKVKRGTTITLYVV